MVCSVSSYGEIWSAPLLLEFFYAHISFFLEKAMRVAAAAASDGLRQSARQWRPPPPLLRILRNGPSFQTLVPSLVPIIVNNKWFFFYPLTSILSISNSFLLKEAVIAHVEAAKQAWKRSFFNNKIKLLTFHIKNYIKAVFFCFWRHLFFFL